MIVDPTRVGDIAEIRPGLMMRRWFEKYVPRLIGQRVRVIGVVGEARIVRVDDIPVDMQIADSLLKPIRDYDGRDEEQDEDES